MRFFIIVCGILLAPVLRGQDLYQTIRGTVLDKQTQGPLPGVVVSLVGSSDPTQATTTDEKGKFRLEHIPIGRWQVKISLISYKEKVLTVVLTSGKESVLNVELEENAVQGDEVVITAEQDKTKTNNKMATVSARVFSADEASRYAGSRNDPARMAANFAGVSGANDSRNDIVIRGNSPLGVLWRLNGLDIPNPNHFGSLGSTGGPISILNNNTLDNSDFITGAFPADYGNATAGVFDLKMRSGNNEKYEFLGQVGFNGFELGTEGPFSRKKKNGSFLVNYRYSTLSVFKYIGLDFGTGAAVPQYQDLTFKVDLPTKKAGKFSVWGIGGLSYVALLSKDQSKGNNLYGYSGRDTYFRSNVGASGISHTYLVNNSSYIKTNIGVSGQYNFIRADRIDTNVVPNIVNPEYRNTSYTWRYSANLTYNKKFNARNFVSTGFYFDWYNTSFVDSINNFDGLGFITLRNYTGQTGLGRVFIQWQHKFTDKLTLNTGLSYQYLLLNGSQSPEPRLGLKYDLSSRQSLSFGAGMHSQLQPLYIYFATAHTGKGFEETNRNLDFTRAAHAVVAYDVSVFNSARIKVEAYYQYLYSVPVRTRSDYFSAINLGADFNSPNVDSLVNKGTGDNYGLELTLEKFYSKGYYVLMTGSLFQSKYYGSDHVYRNTAFNGNYVVNLLGGKEFKIRKRHTLALDTKLTFAGGKHYVPIDLAASMAANEERYIGSQAYVPQFGPYFRWDIKPSYKLNTKRFTHEVSVDIQNVTHHNNVFQQQYDLNTHTIKTDYQLKFFVIPQYRLTF
ncbi:MAG: TonB-dependent receptor [Bacteroidetes bacterium]|nr:TonB-dependent receptor [Bacteroidota bacterium]